jgi:Ca-activated chloride channel family protein
MKKLRTRMLPIAAILMCTLMIMPGCSSDTSEQTPSNQPVPTNSASTPTSQPEPSTPASQTPADEPKQQETLALDAPPLPETAEDLFAYPPGRFAGVYFEKESKEIIKVLHQFPALTEENQQAYWNKLVSLFAGKYPDPADVVSQWEQVTVEGLSVDPTTQGMQKKEHYNVEVILDASGSMAGKIGNKSKMELAKEAILKFAESLPKEANLALRVYGHKGSNAETDKTTSCGSSEQVYGLQTFNQAKLKEALASFKPTGWTPIALSLEQAKQDFATYGKENSKNIIYLVSDGVETCGGDPVKVAKELLESNIAPVVNVIGFDVDDNGKNALQEIAKAGNGKYVSVKNQKELLEEFDNSADQAHEWLLWYLNTDNKRLITYFDKMGAVRNYDHEFFRIALNDASNLNKAINNLKYEGLIDESQRNQLKAFLNRRDKTLEKIRNEVFADLEKLVKEQDKELAQKIREKYKSQKQ